MSKKVTIEVRTHDIFKEWETAGLKGQQLLQLFGRHQFIYKKDDNEISLVEYNISIGPKPQWVWEAYCLKGKLFKDVIRFNYKQEAENKIMRYLDLEGCL